ncbi:MAG: hypothetical protein R3308_09910, partial [Thiohalobacterales bacterium]|nr:hypothetical protein [Thiohalobacterales bacterium]
MVNLAHRLSHGRNIRGPWDSEFKEMCEALILDQPYRLSEAQLAAYRRDGHIFLPQVLPANAMHPLRQTIAAAADRYNTETRPLEERDT